MKGQFIRTLSKNLIKKFQINSETSRQHVSSQHKQLSLLHAAFRYTFSISLCLTHVFLHLYLYLKVSAYAICPSVPTSSFFSSSFLSACCKIFIVCFVQDIMTRLAWPIVRQSQSSLFDKFLQFISLSPTLLFKRPPINVDLIFSSDFQLSTVVNFLSFLQYFQIRGWIQFSSGFRYFCLATSIITLKKRVLGFFLLFSFAIKPKVTFELSFLK